MKTASSSLTKLPSSSLLSEAPEISKEEYRGLPRVERIYQAIMYPRFFQMTDAEEDYLEMMRRAYNIMMAADTDQQARINIRVINPSEKLSVPQVLELIASTKDFFGKIEIRNIDFDRAVMRHRLNDLAGRARTSGDIWNERLALKQLTDLDALAVREKEAAGPVIPPLPNVVMSSTKKHEQAIVESTPYDESEEE